jgi:hypothetical protein
VAAGLPVERPRDAGERDAQPGDVVGIDLDRPLIIAY